MCCLITSLFLLGPRAAILVWWLIEPVRWNATFDTPLLGFLVLPWTTPTYVAVYPAGINGFDYLFLGIGLAFDLFTWFGGGYGNRGRMRSYRV